MRDVRTIAAAAKRYPKRTQEMPPALKYYEVKYCCTHGGRTLKSDSTGARTVSPFKMDCPFFLGFTTSDDGQSLVLSTVHAQHEGHEISQVS